ncbi:MAG: FkbM family methyltransferase, partial [Pseudomonadota bacterium]
LREDWFALSQSETAVQALDVAVVTLTDLMSEFGVPRYIKIDVEGFESEVLKGLDQPAPLLSFEYHLRELEDLRASMSGLERLGAWHYNCIAMNGRDFSQTDWLAMQDFFELAEGGAIPRKGDVFARPADMSALSRPA